MWITEITKYLDLLYLLNNSYMHESIHMERLIMLDHLVLNCKVVEQHARAKRAGPDCY